MGISCSCTLLFSNSLSRVCAKRRMVSASPIKHDEKIVVSRIFGLLDEGCKSWGSTPIPIPYGLQIYCFLNAH